VLVSRIFSVSGSVVFFINQNIYCSTCVVEFTVVFLIHQNGRIGVCARMHGVSTKITVFLFSFFDKTRVSASYVHSPLGRSTVARFQFDRIICAKTNEQDRHPHPPLLRGDFFRPVSTQNRKTFRLPLSYGHFEFILLVIHRFSDGKPRAQLLRHCRYHPTAVKSLEHESTYNIRESLAIIEIVSIRQSNNIMYSLFVVRDKLKQKQSI